MLQLRYYQQQAVDNIRNSYLNKFKAPLLVLPTGGGKTVVFSYIAATSQSKGNRVLILVHRVELLRQTSAKLSEAGVYHGLISPKYTPNFSAPVQVASVQTLIKRLTKIPPPDLIIIDEAHHATAGSWRTVLNAFPNARVLGVTATPCRGDGSGLGQVAGGVFDDIVIGPQVPELIQAGFLVKPIIYAPKEKLDLSAIKITRGDYDVKQVSDLVDKPTITGDAVSHYKRICPGTPAVVFCVSVNHAKHVAEEFRKAGFRAFHADGSLEDDVRARILNGLGNGTVDVVTSCDLISEGTDIPAIGCAILLRPTQSLGLYIQQVGRALRIAEGKKHTYILDHVGNVLTHGLPEEHRDWTLEGEKKRKKKKIDDVENVKVTQCPKCYCVHETNAHKVNIENVWRTACPSCGHIYERKEAEAPKQVDGELVEVDPNLLKRQKVVEVAKARTREELELIAEQRGYKAGWVNHMLSSREKKNT